MLPLPTPSLLSSPSSPPPVESGRWRVFNFLLQNVSDVYKIKESHRFLQTQELSALSKSEKGFWGPSTSTPLKRAPLINHADHPLPLPAHPLRQRGSELARVQLPGGNPCSQLQSRPSPSTTSRAGWEQPSLPYLGPPGSSPSAALSSSHRPTCLLPQASPYLSPRAHLCLVPSSGPPRAPSTFLPEFVASPAARPSACIEKQYHSSNG